MNVNLLCLTVILWKRNGHLRCKFPHQRQIRLFEARSVTKDEPLSSHSCLNAHLVVSGTISIRLSQHVRDAMQQFLTVVLVASPMSILFKIVMGEIIDGFLASPVTKYGFALDRAHCGNHILIVLLGIEEIVTSGCAGAITFLREFLDLLNDQLEENSKSANLFN